MNKNTLSCFNYFKENLFFTSRFIRDVDVSRADHGDASGGSDIEGGSKKKKKETGSATEHIDPNDLVAVAKFDEEVRLAEAEKTLRRAEEATHQAEVPEDSHDTGAKVDGLLAQMYNPDTTDKALLNYLDAHFGGAADFSVGDKNKALKGTCADLYAMLGKNTEEAGAKVDAMIATHLAKPISKRVIDRLTLSAFGNYGPGFAQQVLTNNLLREAEGTLKMKIARRTERHTRDTTS